MGVLLAQNSCSTDGSVLETAALGTQIQFLALECSSHMALKSISPLLFYIKWASYLPKILSFVTVHLGELPQVQWWYRSEMSLLNAQNPRSAAFPKTPSEQLWRAVVLLASFTLGLSHCSPQRQKPQSDFNTTSHEGFAEIILEHSKASLTPAVTPGDLDDELKSAPHQHEFMVGTHCPWQWEAAQALAPSLGHGPVWGGAAQDPLCAVNPCPWQGGWNKRIQTIPCMGRL